MVDKFLHKIPFEKVADVLQTMSYFAKNEFSGKFFVSPIEMMATGGYSVVVPNGGNKEYLIDEENCLLYPCGEIDKAVEKIKRICNDEELRERLYRGGMKTAENRELGNYSNRNIGVV